MNEKPAVEKPVEIQLPRVLLPVLERLWRDEIGRLEGVMSRFHKHCFNRALAMKSMPSVQNRDALLDRFEKAKSQLAVVEAAWDALT